jgi:hypothetical protein
MHKVQLSTWFHVNVTSGFRREVAENYALLSYYAASSGNFLSTFRDSLSDATSGFKNLKERPTNHQPKS